jgi:CheY-like chemotaxis protein
MKSKLSLNEYLIIHPNFEERFRDVPWISVWEVKQTKITKMITLVYLDDDKIQRLLMKKLMKIHLPDCLTELFSEPEELSTWMDENRVDIILSDLNFETSSGWDWVADFSSKSTAPIVFITANCSPEDRRKSAEFPQVKWVMDKPISEGNWRMLQNLISTLA